ncbi:MAG TPA: tRNA preQ1(34) S-adenosylmethionine ribosyltransferase-isomerase QueA [Anaerolineales bacterium]|nr:tRNA preQ1(34) S-adenosylmethionine ribosyltransferase-isomerase QueA [Anaerolineales bacterium]
MKTSDFDYDLPAEFIAQTPVEPRDAARLMVFERETGRLEHTTFREVGRYLKAGDLLVLNETRVIPARLYAHKIPTGGRVELLLLKRKEHTTWEVLAGGKRLVKGVALQVESGPRAEVTAVLEGARRLVRFDEQIEPYLVKVGHVPLPPYIHADLADAERYQTVYARQPGSAAAPTAGLHFTPGLMEALKAQGVGFATVTLHIGLDTFAPVTEGDPRQHLIHSEWCQLTEETAEGINRAQAGGGRIIAVGTTSVRTLESAARVAGGGKLVGPMAGTTDLFILPGYRFRAVQAMITNFHLPRSSLIMLVSAFVGRERLLALYEQAKRESYRFYSFGDAMLIL